MKRKLLVYLMVITMVTNIITGCGKVSNSNTSDTKSTKMESVKEDVVEEGSDDFKTMNGLIIQ